MTWLQLKIDTTKADAPQYEALLEEIGAAAVLMEDSADQPLLEPPPGATPLWDATRVIGVFTVDSEIDAIVEYLEGQLGHPLPAHRVEVLEDKDWVRAWMDHYHPMQFGRRLWVVPSWTPPPVPDAINLLLDPGLAFGTGTHPTTALCLEWLDEHIHSQKAVIDYGCGSGILAITALKLGAARAQGVDIDEQALLAARDNAVQNQVEATFFAAEDNLNAVLNSPAHIVVANILANPLTVLAPLLATLTARGGMIALSGILAPQADEVRDAYRPWFDMHTTEPEDEWVLLAGSKR